MTDLKLMETKPHTWEVTEGLVDKDIDKIISIETDRRFGKWIIRINDNDNADEPSCVVLTGAQAAAVAEFITGRIRKRW